MNKQIHYKLCFLTPHLGKRLNKMVNLFMLENFDYKSRTETNKQVKAAQLMLIASFPITIVPGHCQMAGNNKKTT